MRDTLHRHFGRRVEMRAHGFVYRGKLIGADEEFIYLLGVMGWIVLPLPAVTSIKPEDAGEAEREFECLPGEKPTPAEEREAKRRYSPRDLRAVHEPEEEDSPENSPQRHRDTEKKREES